jgi:hypothetical protein
MRERERRTGRKVREESLLLDDCLREEVKREFRKHNILRILCDEKGWSRSDYERVMKWLNKYNRRVEFGLLIDALSAIGVDWKIVFERAWLKRRYELLKS